MSDMRDFIASSDDEDDISITSTAPSEARETYPLERILAERTLEEQDDDGLFVESKEYLVKWEGYDVDRSTWEPGSNFENNDTLHEWQAQSMKESRKFADAFDVEAWENRQEAIREAKEQRHARRNRQRKRRGLPETVWPEEEEGSDGEDANPTDERESPVTILSCPPTTPKDDKPNTSRRKQPLYDSSTDDSLNSNAPVARRKRKLMPTASDRPAKKPSIEGGTRKGLPVPIKGGNPEPTASAPNTIPTRTTGNAISAAPKRASAVPGWFSSFTQPKALVPRPGATSNTLSIRNGPQPTVSSGPLMKRSIPSNVPRKTTGEPT